MQELIFQLSAFGTASQVTLPLIQHPLNHTTTLLAAQYGTTFNVEVTIADQTFQLLVDTGSSDTYVVRNDFVCINETTNQEISQAACGYAPHAYHESSTYRLIPNQTFGVQYGNGVACGVMAREDITLAGITVPGQAIGIADRSHPMGDGINSGVLGLAYPSLTSAHPRNHTDNTTFWFDREIYRPLFNTMYEQGLVAEPYFSIALAHSPHNLTAAPATTFGGYLTLGDYPPVAHNATFAKVPVEILKNIPPSFTSGKRTRSYWAFTVSAVTWGEPEADDCPLITNATAFQALTDTGNDFSFLPMAVVDSVNALFDPPAVYSEALGYYLVDCDAQAPVFGVAIGGQTFYHEGRDLIYRTEEGYCVSSLAASEDVAYEGIVLNILGVPFLKNVVSAYDFGKNELRFAQRLD
ncbi:acid protease [Aspergillus violaceofuscus CBS 115571]|uniref:Acid protease n=1 Tax=Aspergillus violaceofuscus (strain CBS 115571) TaxID=1450538 RepID=A0A2V5I4J1_ASPV1|nr:acid protease [Aspergillus violaceofuscus CBS 115571]